MMKILVHIAVQDGRPKRSSLEVLSHCRSLSDVHGVDVEALILHPSAARVAETVAKYGPARIFTLSHSIFGTHLNTPVLSGLETGLKESGADMLVFASSESVKDVLGALAVRVDASVLPEVARFDIDGDSVVATRPVMAAKRMAKTRSLKTPVLVSVRAGSYEAVERPGDCATEEIDFEFDEASSRQTLREVVVSTGETVDLSEARVVVAAGRGVKDEDGKHLVESLAGLFGGAIGSSRAVVESGLFSAATQIGQTGKVVSPELYFAVGISGAIQHVAGMSNSRVIVAVNRDPDAPIFDYATFGLVGDLYEILPCLIEEFKSAVNTP